MPRGLLVRPEPFYLVNEVGDVTVISLPSATEVLPS